MIEQIPPGEMPPACHERFSVRRFLSGIVRFVKAALSEQDGLPSTKRLLFAATVLACLAFSAFDVIKHGGLRSESIQLATILVGSTAAAYGVTQFAK